MITKAYYRARMVVRRHVPEFGAGACGIQLVGEIGEGLLPALLVGDTFVYQPDQAFAVIHRRELAPCHSVAACHAQMRRSRALVTYLYYF